MDHTCSSYDDVLLAKKDLRDVTGCGSYIADMGAHPVVLETLDIREYKDFAIQKCADMLDAVLAETFPKCEYCSNRSNCHGSSDCVWSKRQDVIQLRNLCRGIISAVAARGELK